MAIQWLIDRPDLDSLSITIKKRSRRGEDGYSLTLSKSLKDLIRFEKYTNMRIGYDVQFDTVRICIQLVKEDVGLPLLNDKGVVRLWFDITDYMGQLVENGIIIHDATDLKLSARKNGVLESSEIPLTTVNE